MHATARDAPSRVAAGVAATRGRARLRWVSRRGALTSRTENATTAIARGRVGVTCDAAKSAVSAVSGVGRGAVVCSAAASNGASASGFDTSKVRIGEEGIIINVYAESLLEAAKEAGGSVLEKVASDMDVLEMAVSAPEFVDYLNNPVVELQAKVTTIKNSAKDLGWHEFTVNALELLLTKNREWVIPDLPYAFKQLYNALAKTMVRALAALPSSCVAQRSPAAVYGCGVRVCGREQGEEEGGREARLRVSHVLMAYHTCLPCRYRDRNANHARMCVHVRMSLVVCVYSAWRSSRR